MDTTTSAFLELGADTTLVEIELAAGSGDPLHRHAGYAQRVEVLDGHLTVQVGGSILVLEAGESAVAPAGAAHSFRNTSRHPVRFRVEVTPGDRGYERSLQVLHGLAADGLEPSLLEHAVLARWAGVRVGGLGALFEPAFTVLAWIARARGVDRKLARAYVTL